MQRIHLSVLNNSEDRVFKFTLLTEQYEKEVKEVVSKYNDFYESLNPILDGEIRELIYAPKHEQSIIFNMEKASVICDRNEILKKFWEDSVEACYYEMEAVQEFEDGFFESLLQINRSIPAEKLILVTFGAYYPIMESEFGLYVGHWREV